MHALKATTARQASAWEIRLSVPMTTPAQMTDVTRKRAANTIPTMLHARMARHVPSTTHASPANAALNPRHAMMETLCRRHMGEAGCVFTPNAIDCDDMNVCTSSSVCQEGAASRQNDTCDDGNACTTDSCDLENGCTYTPNSIPCDDGDTCTIGDSVGGCMHQWRKS